ncbi:beta strand repeat-containing protein, partial [Novipirellula maiorica]
MKLDSLLAQLRRRSRLAQTRKSLSKKKSRHRLATRRSSFESLELRRLLASDVSLSGNELVVTDTTNGHDAFTVEISGGNYVISNNSPITASGIADSDSDPNKVSVAIGSITGVNVNAAGGNDTITLKNFAGKTATLSGGTGNDTFKFDDAWGTATIVDAGGGTVDFSDVSAALGVSQSGGNVVVLSDDASQVSYAAASNFSGLPLVLDQTTAQTALNDGLGELATLGGELESLDNLSEKIDLVGQSISDALPIGQILNESLSQPIAAYFSNLGSDDPDLVGLLTALDSLNGSGYSGPGSLNFTVAASGVMSGDVMTLDLSVVATVTHSAVSLDLGETILGLDGALEEWMTMSGVTADLSTGFQWDFSVGVDATATPFFFADFDNDISVTADVNVANASFDLSAGLLGMDVGPYGAASAPSTINLDLDATFNARALMGLDGTNGGASDGVLQINELKDANRLDRLDSGTAATAQLDIDLYATAPGVSGVTDGTPATIHLSDDLFSAAAPTFSENLTSLGIPDFYNLNAKSVLQVMQQFGSYVDVLGSKTFDNERLLLGASATIGDLVNMAELYQDEFLKRIELPPHTATTRLTDIVGVPESGETLSSLLGTSGDNAPEFTVTLQDGTTFDVDLDGTTTLADVASRIQTASPGTAKFEVVTESDGAILLVDKTIAASDSDKFHITAKQDGSSEDYAAAAKLGLTAVAVKKDVVGDDTLESVIQLAPNPGANFSTLQQMLSLPTGGGSPYTTVGPMSYDAATSTFRFTLDIAKSFSDSTDTLNLPDFGSLSGLSTTGSVDLLNPTATLHLPFELALTNVGFDTPLSSSTPISQLNLGAGVALLEGVDDIRVHLADGTTFAVDFDPSLASVTLASLNGGASVPTSGDANADLQFTLNDGTTFAVDLDAAVASTSAAPSTLGELVEAIQAAADAADSIAGTVAAGATANQLIDASAPFGAVDSLVGREVVVGEQSATITANTADTLTLSSDWSTAPTAGDSYEVTSRLTGFASLDAARGTLSLIDATTPVGSPALAVTGSAAASLGIDGTAEQRNLGGSTFTVVENSLVTLGDLIAKIEAAATAAGLTLPSSASFSAGWDFDVQIADAGIVLVDRTSPAASITGTAESGAATDELQDTAAFTPDALVGRVVTITGGAGAGQSLTIIANTADTLTLDSDWDTAIDATSTYTIANDLIVASLNNSGARVSLGLASAAKDQASVSDSRLFDGSGGVVVRTNGTPAADLTITLSGGGTSFSVDLDGIVSPTTIKDLAERIADAAGDAGVTTADFEVFTDSGTGTISLIDRGQAGAVSTFTVTNAGGSFAATDLGLASGSEVNVDFSTPVGSELDPEFVIELKSPAKVLGGDPLHGDTAAAHLKVQSDSTPTLQFDLDVSASGASGSGQYGPLAVDFSDLTISSATSKVAASLTLETATVGQLWGGLGSPFAWLVGDQVNFNNSLDLSMKLRPEPSITGVGSGLKTDFDVDINNLYDVRDNVETVTPVMSGMDDVQGLLVAVEQLTLADMFDYLDSVGAYLVELQTQSKLADRLPGLSKSLGELFGFGKAFQARVEELKALPEELQPKSLQALNAQLSAPLEGASLVAGLSFDPANKNLLLDLHLDLNAISTTLPVSLDLTKLGLDLTAQGLQKVAAIVDTLSAAPMQVDADGVVEVSLGIDLSDPSAPSPFLAGAAGSGSGTEASFDIRGINDDALTFTTLLGSLPAEVISGFVILDSDGDGVSTSPATYTVDLQSNAAVMTTTEARDAAAASSTTVQVAGELDAKFELSFPQQVIPSDAPNTVPFITVGVGNVNDPSGGSSTLTTNLLGGDGNWPTFEVLTQNFSLADSMDGFKLGFHDLFTKLDQMLDTALLGQKLPLVGDQLGEAADFLLQMRDSVVDNLNLYGKSISMDSVRQGIFDAFGPGGFNWLQNDPNSGDTVVNIDDIKMVKNGVTVDGRELVIGVEYQMDLSSPAQLLAAPVDLDLLLPGLGLQLDALADVQFGFHLPLTVGVSIADGVYIDVDGVNDLEISLDVALPKAAVTMAGDPRLTFTNPSNAAPKITRDRGNWILDGFRVGQIIEVSGSSGNDGDYLVKSFDATGLEMTLESTDANLAPASSSLDRVVPEGPTSGIGISVMKVSQTGGPSLTFTDVIKDVTPDYPLFVDLPPGTFTVDVRDQITRSTGSWLEDGFRLGDTITITGTSTNDDVYTILAIDPSGRTITVDKVLTNETTSNAFVRKEGLRGIQAELGVLPFRVWDQTPDQSELTGTFNIDFLSPSIAGAKTRLSLNDLIAAQPFPVIPAAGFTSAPLDNLLTITETTGHELTVHPISLAIETDLPPGAAFPPYRMQLDITNWDWDVTGSLATEISTPSIAFNDVQFELVGFVRDFLGPAITRMSVALEAVDPLLVFLQSEAMPIVSLLFGKTSYVSAPGTFGGETQIGDFTGAATALRALANGGKPFERDVIGEFFSDLFENKEFDDITLLPIMMLTGEEWIDLGSFVVNGAVARGQSGDLFDSNANEERSLGSLKDKPLRLTGNVTLSFTSNTITLPSSNDSTWTAAGFAAGQTIRISGDVNPGTYTVQGVTDSVLTITGGTFAMTGTVYGIAGDRIAVQNADGSRAGSILGQIAAIARDTSSSAQSAAQSLVTTQLLPGLKRVGGIGGLTNKFINNDHFQQGSGRTTDPIQFPIFEQSFGLLLGETGFDGRSETESHFADLQYSRVVVDLVSPATADLGK